MLTVDCGKGTYIRSICHDLGELTGCPAHMRFLLRTRSGAFGLDTAMTIEELTAHCEAGDLASCLIPMDAPLGHIPMVEAPRWMEKLVRNGSPMPLSKLKDAADLEEGRIVRVYWDGGFWGMAAKEGDMLTWRCQIPPAA